jgi:hypothetical protein
MSQHDSQRDDPELETLLRNVQLSQPSRRLDGRIRALLRPRWRIFVGPLSGFAAGVLVTVAVFRFAVPLGGHPVKPIEPAQADRSQVPDAPQPAPVRAMLIESRDVTTLGAGEVNGLPIRMEQSRARLVLFRPTADGGLWRAEVELPKETIVRNVHFN